MSDKPAAAPSPTAAARILAATPHIEPQLGMLVTAKQLRESPQLRDIPKDEFV